MIQVVPGSFTPTDAYALERFEALALSQKPADKPWEPVTDYSFDARKAVEGPHAELILNVFQPKRIVDVGCGPGHLMRLIREVAAPYSLRIRGLDIAADVRWKVDDDVWQWNIASEGFGQEDYLLDYLSSDLVICREVVEHLTVLGIRTAVANLCRMSSRFVYVTTRFANNPTHLLSVDTADDLDPTHISMLTQTFLRVLFVLEGFKRRADLEAKLDWRQLGRVLVYERSA